MVDLYGLMGVEHDATEEEIRTAYRAKAREMHPDAGGDVEDMKALTHAMAVLGDPEKRARYDRGDSEQQQTHVGIAMSAFMAAVEKTLGTHRNPFEIAERIISDELDGTNEQVAACSVQIVKAQRMLDQMPEERETLHPYRGALLGLIHHTQSCQRQLKARRDELKRAIEFLESAETDGLFPQPEQPTRARTSFTDLGTGGRWETTMAP